MSKDTRKDYVQAWENHIDGLNSLHWKCKGQETDQLTAHIDGLKKLVNKFGDRMEANKEFTGKDRDLFTGKLKD